MVLNLFTISGGCHTPGGHRHELFSSSWMDGHCVIEISFRSTHFHCDCEPLKKFIRSKTWTLRRGEQIMQHSKKPKLKIEIEFQMRNNRISNNGKSISSLRQAINIGYTLQYSKKNSPIQCNPTTLSVGRSVTSFMAVFGLSSGSICQGPYHKFVKVLV